MAENENAGGYVVIHEWMVTEMHLKGTELVVFALIYGFTQAKGGFSGSLAYLQKWTNCTKQGVINCLKSLEQSHLIEREERQDSGRRYIDYRSKKFTCTGQESLPAPVKKVDHPGQESLPAPVKKVDHPGQESLPAPVKKVDHPGQKSLPAPVKKVDHPGQKSLPHNIEYNIDYIIADSVCGGKAENIHRNPQPDTHTQEEGYKPPSLEEVAAYCQEIQSTVDPAYFHDFYTGNGWKTGDRNIKNWKAVVRSWDKQDRKNGKTTLPENRPGYEPPQNPLDAIQFD